MEVFPVHLTLSHSTRVCGGTMMLRNTDQSCKVLPVQIHGLGLQTLLPSHFNICVWAVSVCQRFDPSHFLFFYQVIVAAPDKLACTGLLIAPHGWVESNFWQGETLSSLTDGTRQTEPKVLQGDVKRYRLSNFLNRHPVDCRWQHVNDVWSPCTVPFCQLFYCCN